MAIARLRLCHLAWTGARLLTRLAVMPGKSAIAQDLFRHVKCLQARRVRTPDQRHQAARQVGAGLAKILVDDEDFLAKERQDVGRLFRDDVEVTPR